MSIKKIVKTLQLYNGPTNRNKFQLYATFYTMNAVMWANISKVT